MTDGEHRRLRAEPLGGFGNRGRTSGAGLPAETDARGEASRDTGDDDPRRDDAGQNGTGPQDGVPGEEASDEEVSDQDAPDEDAPDDDSAEEPPDPDVRPVSALFSREPERGATSAVRRGRGCLAVLVALAVLVVGGFFAWDRASGWVDQLTATPDYTNAKGGHDVTVTVPEGAPVRDIGKRLDKADVVKSSKAFNQAVKDHSGTVTVQAGSYQMRTKVPAKKALYRLLHPNTYRVHSTVRIKEGLRLSKQVATLAKQSEISKKSYQQALDHPEKLDLPTWAKDRPQGFLFPDTYEITKKSTATSVLRQMTEEFTTVAAGLNLSGRAHALHLSRYQILIVASLIEAEVKKPEDRAKVARVIYNRLAKKKPLQLDSTVHYVAGKDDSDNNLVTTTKHERSSRSPYNTYKHKGLPPGPINSPGKAALKAAAHPAHGDWLYFVSVDPDSGKTAFTDSAKQHHKNVKKFQKWCKEHQGRC